MTQPTKRESKRLDAIQKVLLAYRNVHDDFLLIHQSEIATAIRAMSPLGATERWAKAVENWAGSVEVSTSEADVRWSMYQGAIFAGWASA